MIRITLKYVRYLVGNWTQELLTIGFVIVLLTIAMSIVLGVGNKLDAVDDWSERFAIHRSGKSSGLLFNKLTTEQKSDAGVGMFEPALVQFNSKTGNIDVNIDCAAFAFGYTKSMTAEKQNLIRKYCQTDVGRAISAEISFWNTNSRMLAVRDNAQHGNNCTDDTAVFFHIPDECYPNNWKVSISDADFVRPVNANLDYAPPTGRFGFLARHSLPGYGDWLNLDVGAIGGSQITLKAVYRPSELSSVARKNGVSIDVIGDVAAIYINGDLQLKETTNNTGVLRCPVRNTDDSTCRQYAIAPNTRLAPRAHQILIPIGNSVVEVELTVNSVPGLPLRISKLGNFEIVSSKIGEVSNFIANRKITLSNHIRLDCLIDGPETIRSTTGVLDDELSILGYSNQNTTEITTTQCRLGWRSTVASASRIKKGRIEILAAGGASKPELLTIEREKSKDETFFTSANARAAELGLIPMLGIDQNDFFSLIGQSKLNSRVKIPQKINLTIDPDVQSIVQDTLASVVSRSNEMKSVSRLLTKRDDGNRRGAVVLLDAGPLDKSLSVTGGSRVGEIVAAVSFPEPKSGFSAWDISALDRFDPALSPLANRVWGQRDRFFTPGSTFKIVTSLAAIDAAIRGDEKIARILPTNSQIGGVALGEMDQVFGSKYNFTATSRKLEIPFGDDKVGTRKARSFFIRNFKKSSMCASLGSDCQSSSRVSISGAIKKSANMWFARLALLLDEDAVSCNRGGGIKEITSRNLSICGNNDRSPLKGRRRELVLERVVNNIFGTQERQLMPVFDQLGWAKPPVGSRFIADPIVFDVLDERQPRRVSLALNGIGQAVQATPLSMATIVASLANGNVVSPRLSKASGTTNPKPLFRPPSPDAPDTPLIVRSPESFLAGLRNAMNRVVNEPGGTAFSAFRVSSASSFRKRVFGKTGTAQIGGADNPPNTAWFIGWIDGFGNGHYKDRKVAFACAITHAEIGRGFGGRVCGPIIREIIVKHINNTANVNKRN